MGFSISGGGFSWLGTLIVVLLVGTAIVVVGSLLSAAKQARDTTVEDEGDDPDLIA